MYNRKPELAVDEILASLKTTIIGKEILYYPLLESTNELLKQMGGEKTKEGTVVLAEEQTSGRGRLQRRWEAEPCSSLLVSILFRPTFLLPSQMHRLTMICALAAADAASEAVNKKIGLKWPNDLVYNDKKLAGVLTEMQLEGEEVRWVVVGVGMNVNTDFSQMPEELSEIAVSLSMIAGHPVSRKSLLISYLQGVEKRYLGLWDNMLPHEEWESRLVTLGKEVTASTPEGTFTGIAEGVNADGALLLRMPNRTVKRVFAGDVTLRKERDKEKWDRWDREKE